MKIALLGYGTVASGLYELVTKYSDYFVTRYNEDITIKYILIRDKNRIIEHDEKDKFITDFELIRVDNEIDIVVEAIGGIEPAFNYIKESLNQKKHVVTANKELIAIKGNELFEVAEENNVSILFEASVCGAIPIIGNLYNELIVTPIEEVHGIINGSTNFILTKMKEDRMNFSNALQLAQELGYAEKNPEYDITGRDAACKLSILSFLAFGKVLDLSKILMEGIEKITLDDIKYADKMGYEIKLIAIAHNSNRGIQAIVAPFLINKKHYYSQVKDNFNAVTIKYDAAEEITFIGIGAGKLPTASALMSNIIHLVKNKNSVVYKKTQLVSEESAKDEFRYYIRFEQINAIIELEHMLDTSSIEWYYCDGNDLVILTTLCNEQYINNIVNILIKQLSIKHANLIRVFD